MIDNWRSHSHNLVLSASVLIRAGFIRYTATSAVSQRVMRFHNRYRPLSSGQGQTGHRHPPSQKACLLSRGAVPALERAGPISGHRRSSAKNPSRDRRHMCHDGGLDRPDRRARIGIDPISSRHAIICRIARARVLRAKRGHGPAPELDPSPRFRK
jgi:hypothetical protein